MTKQMQGRHSVLRRILPKMRFSSFASCQSALAFSWAVESAAASILSQYFVSRDSFRHRPILCRKSFFALGISCFAIVRSDAGAGAYQLRKNRSGYGVRCNLSGKSDDLLAKFSSSLLKIKAVRSSFRALSILHSSLIRGFELRHSDFWFRHSGLPLFVIA